MCVGGTVEVECIRELGSFKSGLEKDFACLECHLVSDGCLLAHVYPSAVQTSSSVAVLQDPVALRASRLLRSVRGQVVCG